MLLAGIVGWLVVAFMPVMLPMVNSVIPISRNIVPVVVQLFMGLRSFLWF